MNARRCSSTNQNTSPKTPKCVPPGTRAKNNQSRTVAPRSHSIRANTSKPFLDKKCAPKFPLPIIPHWLGNLRSAPTYFHRNIAVLGIGSHTGQRITHHALVVSGLNGARVFQNWSSACTPLVTTNVPPKLGAGVHAILNYGSHIVASGCCCCWGRLSLPYHCFGYTYTPAHGGPY